MLTNKQYKSIGLKRLKLPFHFLLSMADIVGEGCFDACVEYLKDNMLPDEAIMSTDAWIQYEAKGNPTWRRAMGLIKPIEQAMHLLPPQTILCMIDQEMLDLDDFAGLALYSRIQGRWPITLVVCDDSNLAALKKQLKLLNLDFSFDTQAPDCIPSEKMQATFQNLTGMGFLSWQRMVEGGSVVQLPDHVHGALFRYIQLGVGEVAISLVNAIRCSNKPDDHTQGMLEAILYRLQFHTHQHALIAKAREPFWWRLIDADYRYGLYYLKAYSATLANEKAIALKYFKRIGVTHTSLADSVNELYQLNIYARYEFISGNSDRAMQIEKYIEKRISELDIEEISLRYVNAMNIARLHRAAKQYNECKDYYLKAYRYIEHRMSESDWVYQAYNFYQVYDCQGQYIQALQHLLESIMAWQAMECPEALSWRPLCAILKGRCQSTSLIAAISTAYHEKLNILIAGLSLGTESAGNTLLAMRALRCYNDLVKQLAMSNYFAGMRFEKRVREVEETLQIASDSWRLLRTITKGLSHDVANQKVETKNHIGELEG